MHEKAPFTKMDGAFSLQPMGYRRVLFSSFLSVRQQVAAVAAEQVGQLHQGLFQVVGGLGAGGVVLRKRASIFSHVLVYLSLENSMALGISIIAKPSAVDTAKSVP